MISVNLASPRPHVFSVAGDYYYAALTLRPDSAQWRPAPLVELRVFRGTDDPWARSRKVGDWRMEPAR